MAMRIQDFGMLHVAPDLSGVVPLNAFEAQAAGVRNLAAGVMELAGTAGTAVKEMQEVRDAGQWAEARDGLYRFEQDVMRELEAGGEPEHVQERWKKALAERLPSYLPGRMSAPVRERVELARESLESAGSIYLQKMSRLGQLEEARRAWTGGVEYAVAQGEAGLAERRIEEGRGVFVTGEEAARMVEDARSRVALNQAVQEVRRDPVRAVSLVSGGVEPPQSPEERKVAQEAVTAYGELKRRYADSVARTVSGGGLLRDDGLANAEKYGLISSGQLRRYTESRDRRREAEFSGVSVPEDDMLLCRMTCLVDEDCGGEGDADAMIEVATSGLPAPQVERLLRRREVMMQVPQETRRAASRRLSSLFRSGAWGPSEDARAVEEWKRVQMELMEAVRRTPQQPEAELEKVFEKENRLQDEGWVGFRDMNKGKEGK